jgi:hypothetical protein
MLPLKAPAEALSKLRKYNFFLLSLKQRQNYPFLPLSRVAEVALKWGPHQSVTTVVTVKCSFLASENAHFK